MGWCMAVAILGCGWLPSATGCGPSLRRMHQADRYFERCYVADLTPGVPAARRLRCWQRWLRHYAAHQPPRRIAYARARVQQLRAGRSLEPLPGLAAAGAPRGAPLVATSRPSPAPPAGDQDEIPRPCEKPCLRRWERCVASCPPFDPECIHSCRAGLHICERACY